MDHCKIDFLIFFHFQLILSKSNFFLQNKKERLAKLVSQDQPHWANDVATIVCVVVAFSFSSIADTSCFSLRNVRSSSSLCGITSIRGEASGFWRRCVILARARYVALQLPHALLRRCCVGGQGLAGGTDRSRRGGRRQPARVCSQVCMWRWLAMLAPEGVLRGIERTWGGDEVIISWWWWTFGWLGFCAQLEYTQIFFFVLFWGYILSEGWAEWGSWWVAIWRWWKILGWLGFWMSDRSGWGRLRAF